MAETTGTARQEAERLVATVLAMASQAGLGGDPKDREPTSGGSTGGDPKDRGSAGATGLTDMISGLVGQFLGGAPDNRPPAGPDQHHAATDPRSAGGQSAGPQSAGGQQASPQSAGPQSAGPQSAGGQQASPQHAGPRGAEPPAAGARYGAGGAAGHGRGRQGAGQQLWELLGGLGGWSTGTAECCVCPICRAIAGVRDPSPHQAERLATGAGEFASGVASLLRAFSTVAGATGATGPARRQPPPRPTATPDQAWSAATRRGGPAGGAPADHEVRDDDDPWTAATRAARPRPAADRATGTHREPRRDPAAAFGQAGARTGKTDTRPETADPVDAGPGKADPAGTRPERADPTDAGPGKADPADAQTGKAEAGTGKADARSPKAGGGGPARAARPVDVWAAATAAATAASGDTAGDTGVAGASSVDHDVPGTAPAASAAEGRGAGPGGAARAGDAV